MNKKLMERGKEIKYRKKCKMENGDRIELQDI